MPLSVPRFAPLPRDARDTLFLLGVIGWIVLLQSPHLPAWCTGLTLAVLAWRGTLALRQRALPGWPWRLGVLLLAMGGVWASHRTLLGQEAGVTMIVLLLALKTLELRARRDAFVVFFLGFFTLLTHFFHSQSLSTALGILVALLGLLTALVNAHMPVGRPPLWRSVRLAGGMALLGAPIMLVLFMLFPRFAPLWGIPNDSTLGRTGLSGQMQVGQIARLAQDDRIALRVEFEPGQRPAQQALYFRGPVLSQFDGTEWRPRHADASRPVLPDSGLQTTGPGVRYRLTMEPSNRPWVLTLEATPELPVLAGQTPRPTPDLQWLVPRPLTDVTRFDAVAYPQHRHGPAQRELALQADLDLPPGFNPRTLQWAQDLQRQLGPETPAATYVDTVLERLRSGGYRYTLEPGLYGRHTADEFWFDRQQGFCEHIASSFVILMRALDIPARVVTGYQGGSLNPVDGVWTVRQSDAHAWAEVWLAERGWTRIDPTAYVMPARTDTVERLRPPPGLFMGALLRANPTLLAHLRSVWEATNNRWNQWVLNYTQSRQLDLLRRLGFPSPSWTDLVQLLATALVLAGLAGAGWTWWERRRQDPWLALLQQARQRLQRHGLALPPHATPRQLAQALAALGGDVPGASALTAQAWQDWLLDLEAWRYDPAHAAPATSLPALRTRWRQLPALPPLSTPASPHVRPSAS
ncbi:DUF3488 and transglutaminase-like domain-containing protein [Aquabacterium sp. A08]|uniref:transglutaminase TgpA family protein n=1 Tax=Aquabacterium sp. A08 TaxID=2718532 RepID=UPI0014207AC0|nr:DUF3488 and transglutaminase-like domain-containing protein [Aquabacterium sp. A08]NIC43182.1 DUF3488 domain-containing transglutaminase family protein [Aquabacterium sp. A08]